MKIIALVLGLILAFGAIGWTIYLAYIPNALPNNAVAIFIVTVLAIILIAYGRSRD